MKIHCEYTRLANPSELRPHPKNPNTHSEAQITRLAKILEYQGFRYPIKVSKRTGLITSGHGRLLAAKQLNLKEVPVSEQEYEDSDQEYADIVSDNSIAEWADLDLQLVNLEVPELGPDFDIDHLGMKDFTIDLADKFDPETAWEGMPEFSQEDASAYRTIKIHFANQSSVTEFAKLMDGQTISERTKFLWFPKLEKQKLLGTNYVSDES